jgi:hypothetical protein
MVASIVTMRMVRPIVVAPIQPNTSFMLNPFFDIGRHTQPVSASFKTSITKDAHFRVNRASIEVIAKSVKGMSPVAGGHSKLTRGFPFALPSKHPYTPETSYYHNLIEITTILSQSHRDFEIAEIATIFQQSQHTAPPKTPKER